MSQPSSHEPNWEHVPEPRRKAIEDVCERSLGSTQAIRWTLGALDKLKQHYGGILRKHDAEELFRAHVAGRDIIMMGRQRLKDYPQKWIFEVITSTSCGRPIYFEFVILDEDVDDISICIVSVHPPSFFRKGQR